MSDERIFMTGGTGFIGSHIARGLRDGGHEVLLYDNFTSYLSPFAANYAANLSRRFPGGESEFQIVRGDVRHRGFLQRTLQDFAPTRIIHLAALPIADVSNRFSEEAMENNLGATVNLLDTATVLKGLRRLVYTSSSMVYGDFKYSPCDEEHPKAPKDLYGGTKLAGEIMVGAYGRRFGIPYTIIRPSAVYGPTDVNRRVGQIFVENALRGKALVLHNGGRSKLDFTHVRDVADGFIRATLADAAENQIFNITRSHGRSLRQLAEIVQACLPEAKIIEREAEVFRPERDALSIDKARDLLGYDPQIDLEEGIPEYVDYVRTTMDPSEIHS